LIEVQGGDSLGISVTGETPRERSDEEAHRMPPGKRPPRTEINGALHCSAIERELHKYLRPLCDIRTRLCRRTF
jgi:hypothetical protein